MPAAGAAHRNGEVTLALTREARQEGFEQRRNASKKPLKSLSELM